MIIYNSQNLPPEMVASAAANKTMYTGTIREAIDNALSSDVFMSFEGKINGLLDALSIPISDDQSYNQFFIHSQKDLESEAGRVAFKANAVPVMPTLDQIHAEAQKRYDEKAVKLQRKADRAAAKAAKNAPLSQSSVEPTT